MSSDQILIRVQLCWNMHTSHSIVMVDRVVMLAASRLTWAGLPTIQLVKARGTTGRMLISRGCEGCSLHPCHYTVSQKNAPTLKEYNSKLQGLIFTTFGRNIQNTLE